MSQASPAANEVAALEKQLAAAKKRAKPKTLAERLKETRARHASSESAINRLSTVIQHTEAEISAYNESLKSRRSLGLPAPRIMNRIPFWTTEDVRNGKDEATRRLTPEEFLAEARTQLAKTQAERDAASRELVTLEEELAAHPTYKKAAAALDKIRDEFIAAAESGDALTDEKTRKTLTEIADRYGKLRDRLRGELFAAGLPDVPGRRIENEFWNFVPTDDLRRSIDNFFSARAKALTRLKQN